MADFCRDCWADLGGDPDLNDLRELCEPGELAETLCEGCGFITVDHTGKRVQSDGS